MDIYRYPRQQQDRVRWELGYDTRGYALRLTSYTYNSKQNLTHTNAPLHSFILLNHLGNLWCILQHVIFK